MGYWHYDFSGKLAASDPGTVFGQENVIIAGSLKAAEKQIEFCPLPGGYPEYISYVETLAKLKGQRKYEAYPVVYPFGEVKRIKFKAIFQEDAARIGRYDYCCFLLENSVSVYVQKNIGLFETVWADVGWSVP